jgi:hypothetical protein
VRGVRRPSAEELGGRDDVTATVNFATQKAPIAVPSSVPVERPIEAVERCRIPV